MSGDSLVAEKTDQAVEILADEGVGLWLTYCRETAEIPEPCLPFLLGFDVVWPTMVAVAPSGEKHVVIGRHDAPNAEALGVYEVHPYDESLAEAVLSVLDAVDPEEIAVNYSDDDVTADGLTHGLYRRLTDLLDGTEYEGRLVSAESVVARLRGVKTDTERRRIRAAADRTLGLFDGMQGAWGPDWTEADVADWLHARMVDEGLDSAWSRDYCPTVHAGGASEVGHTKPGDLALPPGELLHLDFGVKVEGYAADLQRVFYRSGDGDDGEGPPADLRTAFEDVRAAIEAGKGRLESGVRGHEVDAVARELIVDRGHEEFQHALGHQVGRAAHDGGTLLGPEWDRYGDAPRREVREGEIYTVELGVDTDYGYVGLEEMVEITGDGAEYVVEPQTGFRLLDG